ncbi:MAG: hypothetical protein JSV91_06090 [Phycisphaerales bacterium]|nr:MAG: hypothetical protein JSV91_06090 [Phycisphaerales bacterium]
MKRGNITGGGRSLLPVSTALCLLLSTTIGCETTKVQSSDGRPLPPEPRPAPRTPADALANAIALRVGAKPIDTNGNGYPDLIQVEAYLFSEPHPTPTYEDGAFVFTLHHRGQTDRPDALPIAEWRIEGEVLESCKGISSLFGPAYTFGLSLMDAGGDEYPLCGADLSCRFEPADGRPPVDGKGVRSLQIGRRSANPDRLAGARPPQ